MFNLKFILMAWAVLFSPGIVVAAQGVEDTQIRLAQVAALDGPAAALGQEMRLGMVAAFEDANENGGIHRRRIILESFDDGYEPDRAIAHVKSLIEGDKHLGCIGAVGTPTSAATQPIATKADMPFINPFTGAGFLRNAQLGNVFNVRSTYAAETEAWIEYLVDRQGMKTIALPYQDDGFGRVDLAGVTAALEMRDMKRVAEGTYTRNSLAVKRALLEIRKAKPDAVVMVGAYKPVAEFIRLSRKLRFNPTFVNISFVGSKALATDLGPDREGVIVSQAVPFPWDTSVPVVAQHQEAFAAIAGDTKPGFVSLEGYLTGRLAIKALEDAGKDLTRTRFLAALRNLGSIDFGGVTMQFGPDDNQGMDDVFLTRITQDGGFVSVE
ncbi:MAG: ABC transporter substrate-binding protein [Sediminimonas qiaohouensis]|uniref:ABC transporter substrate-binding protein n=1 Tax=Sediminimonas qiaohouensis TaxID=552061 RepID=A0A7C9L706_9RHOB|nr:ABC transporter substrate-binding protein [Sediminimonas qiaohouensis]MTJ03835.1 ABC transporter substrate-binding protein [Sediminimonas qiaohouensis]